MPEALKYHSLTEERRTAIHKSFREKQFDLDRGRVLHVRHIIPHSDLQAWMHLATRDGDKDSKAGKMRRVVDGLLTSFGEKETAQKWRQTYQQYEAVRDNPFLHRPASVLTFNRDVVKETWERIEWHEQNVFLGHGGINTAIQNRFDAGVGALESQGSQHIEKTLYPIWKQANTLRGLNPTEIQEMSVYSTHLGEQVRTLVAEHRESRPLQAVLGRLQRADYESALTKRRRVEFQAQNQAHLTLADVGPFRPDTSLSRSNVTHVLSLA